MVKELNLSADKYNVDHIELENSPPFPDNFFATGWSWRSAFFMEYFKLYEDSINYTFYPHYRSWLDWTILQCSIMIWNLVNNTYKEEHKKTGVVPKSPLSKKKGRDSIEAVADYYAVEESNKFEEKFK